MSDRILQQMQWYDYSKQSPKLLVIGNTQDVLTLEESIVVELLHLCGWDIVIAIPTGYNITGNIISGQMQEFIRGETVFDLQIGQLTPVEDRGNRKGFFSRLFG